MKKVSKAKLLDILSNTKGATFVTVITETEPRMRKTGNPYYGHVKKLSHVNGVINWHYQNAVNRQRVREGHAGNFEPESRAWGERIPKTPLVKHKDAYYLELKVEKALGSKYVTKDGTELNEKVLEPWLPAQRSGAEHQGLEKEVTLRDYKLDNIRYLTMNGVQYAIV